MMGVVVSAIGIFLYRAPDAAQRATPFRRAEAQDLPRSCLSH
jgi:hypothetical protein